MQIWTFFWKQDILWKSPFKKTQQLVWQKWQFLMGHQLVACMQSNFFIWFANTWIFLGTLIFFNKPLNYCSNPPKTSRNVPWFSRRQTHTGTRSNIYLLRKIQIKSRNKLHISVRHVLTLSFPVVLNHLIFRDHHLITFILLFIKVKSHPLLMTRY